MLLAGSQLNRTNFSVQRHQGHQALLGINTVLPFELEKLPFSADAIWVFLSGRICVNGRDFSVGLTDKKITWLSTAPYGIAVADWIEIQYLNIE